MEKGKCERHFDVRIQIKLQEAGEGEGVGNDNEIGLDRWSDATEHFPWRGEALRGVRLFGVTSCLFREAWVK